MELLMEFMGKGLVTMLMISMPCVMVAAFIGLVVGVIQAVTQVQEQTIAAAPKILGVFLVLLIFGMGYVRVLADLVKEASMISFNVIPKSDNYVLPADYYKYTKPFDDEMNVDSFKNVPSAEEMMKKAGKPPFVNNSDKLDYKSSSRMQKPTPNFMERKKIMGR